MEKHCAVFSCKGLGDGLIAQVLSHNLYLNGCKATLFHPFLAHLQGWFPTLAIRPFPSEKDLAGCLSKFDRFFIIYEKTPWMEAVLQFCQKKYPSKTTILNPIATHKRDYLYWENGRFDGTVPFVDNLYAYAKGVLNFCVATKSNGIQVPSGICRKREEKRVVIHPTSSRPGKNWEAKKFQALSEKLKERGFHPVYILTDQERELFPCDLVEAPSFSSLHDLCAYVCESGYMIGNDSGIGHLASCLGLPTLTICRSKLAADFWRPAWGPSKVLTPPSWIPNLKGLRWRDKHWKRWISVSKAYEGFFQLIKNSS
ncbi:MAG: hypothetical protein HYZ48_01995 [Chlamydiales bacterium]|nr:hypothetical protein [Chlamydiales bacterium]